MGKTQISLWIPEEIHRKVKDSGWGHQEIYLTGIKAKLENPQLISRLNELEIGNKKLQDFCARLSNKLAEVDNRSRGGGN